MTEAKDGDWVQAKVVGQVTSDLLDWGNVPTETLVTGRLSILSDVGGVRRYSIAGWSVDPDTIVVARPPTMPPPLPNWTDEADEDRSSP